MEKDSSQDDPTPGGRGERALLHHLLYNLLTVSLHHIKRALGIWKKTSKHGWVSWEDFWLVPEDTMLPYLFSKHDG